MVDSNFGETDNDFGRHVRWYASIAVYMVYIFFVLYFIVIRYLREGKLSTLLGQIKEQTMLGWDS